jgi:serine/threonine protein kinase
MASFGNYQLLEPIGTGELGTTYRAQSPDGGEMAIKVIDKVDIESTSLLGAVAELTEFAASMDHARLYPITEVIELPDTVQLGYAMPLAPMTLAGVFGRGQKIPPKQGFKMLGQLASGLQYLHDQEVAHGGIKPTNVMIDGEGNALLADLPMAHMRELGLVPATFSKQHHFFLPPEREPHAPPELIGDVYSLGVLAVMLLTGKIPFDHHEHEARSKPRIDGLPPAVTAVLTREINPQIRWRYQTLTEFMVALKDATQGKLDAWTERYFGVDAQTPPEDT